MQSLRDVVHRLSKQQLSVSRTSINSQKKAKSEIVDTKSKTINEPGPTSEISDTASAKLVTDQNKSSMYPTWSSG